MAAFTVTIQSMLGTERRRRAILARNEAEALRQANRLLKADPAGAHWYVVSVEPVKATQDALWVAVARGDHKAARAAWGRVSA